MDIDCDGARSSRDDGRCGSSTDTQSETRWKSYVNRYSDGQVDDLDANVVPYVVLGNEGSYSPTFDPRKYGIQPLSVVAVVCGEKLVYGVWGDTNGDDGPPLVGEASIALATECFGEGITGDSGHDGRDVLYLAFSGDDAVPRKQADWSAKTFEAFEESIEGVGDSLVGRLG